MTFNLTPEQCEFIRALRIDQETTWRGVAREVYEKYGIGDRSFSQLVGSDLCAEAAAFFKQDHMKEPWN